MRDLYFEKELKKAVHEVCLAMAAWNASLAVEYEFPASYKDRLCSMLVRSEKRIERKRTMLRAAACFAALILAFSVICAASPKVWAAVRSWYVYLTAPDRLVYDFNHEENDHAFPVVRPEDLPEGFALSTKDEGEGHSVQIYNNMNTGDYLKFSYQWATVGDIKKLEKLERAYNNVSIFMGQKAISYTENGLRKLAWYDRYSQISYWAESNMKEEDLINIFSASVEMHPPFYEPTWLPEGYVEYALYIDKGESVISYINKETQDIITINSSDLGETDGLFVYGDGAEKPIIVVINGIEASVYCHKDGSFVGTDLVMVDESAKMVHTIQTGLIDLELVVHIAESLEKVDAFTR